MHLKILGGVLVCFLVVSCSPSRKVEEVVITKKPIKTVVPKVVPKVVVEENQDVFIEQLMRKYPKYFDSILFNKDNYNVQIIYTQINRKVNNEPVLTTHTFNLNRDKYRYPASTVKLPAVALALQRLNELKDKGIDKNTTMITEAEYSGQTPVYNDPLTPDGKPTIASYVKKILLVSDNDAFNRLYEFLGPDYINGELYKMGYTDVQIRHRLQIFLTPDENLHTNPIKFLDGNNNVIYYQPMKANQIKFSERHDSLGKMHFVNDKFVAGPMDFSKKNRFGLEDLNNILRSLIFPQSVPAKQRFNLTPDDYNFIYKYMSAFPGESVYPIYDTSVFYDAYGKLLLYGSERGVKPKGLRIFNKEGDAYGHLTDAAYIIDPANNVEFFLSAAIYCNSKGVFSDENYEYETIGYPFLKHIGQVFYDYELNRPKKVKPDFVGFRIVYDK